MEEEEEVLGLGHDVESLVWDKLPLATLAKARAVSLKWNSGLLPRCKGLLLVFRITKSRQLLTFEPRTGHWHALPGLYTVPGCKVIGAESSLICTCVDTKKVAVGNLITRKWTEVPYVASFAFNHRKFSFDASPSSFDLVVPKKGMFYLYQQQVGAVSRITKTIPHTVVSEAYHLVAGGRFYCCSAREINCWSMNGDLLESFPSTWPEDRLPSFDGKMIMCSGELFVIDSLVHSWTFTAVWRFSRDNASWMVEAECPQHAVGSMKSKGCCFDGVDTLWLVLPNRNDGGVDGIWSYSISNKQWRLLPNSSSDSARASSCFKVQSPFIS